MSESSEAEIQSWNGGVPEVEEELIPIDIPKFKHLKGFASNFNKNPLEMVKKSIEVNNNLDDASALGPFLFYNEGVSPIAMTKLVFGPDFPFDVRTFLFYFFSSISHEYTILSKSTYYCLSRIAFPDNPQQIQIIFDCFASAYCTCNPEYNYDLASVIAMAKTLLIASGYNIPNGKLPLPRFLDLCKYSNIPDNHKMKLYDEINKKPIPIFFTFTHFSSPPEYEKKGMLKKIGGLFKTKKDRCFAIDGFVLKYYNNNTMRDLIGELDIPGTISSFIPATKKEPDYLLIRRKDGGSLGYKISKEGVRKKSNHDDYIAYAEKEDILSWANTLNLISFWQLFIDTLQ
ncbi:hypothetical protein TVAG_110380 [Trichomonas vaginalis G3]|uniref:SEC7 domain-containing protein n=1 Tax=Trichomonas vaginalis (strain ATCC PRA-98 / G3) TaxID=412133 RepID=A2DGN9_TRIV3|nr:regulation of ARF protein signal transduction [Trichomonas vaginalis G3]EAY20426.1 hypothetical protein TVAG_110380 [Trichomonas vaginalis G3]KAI5490524.1 regulation of ARF protein signal transduction [Trichomonas vaginalis G3]|eukprot:XP_001581412.1 hypothetical protein [Trichomonas vaginalis G3]